MQALGLTDGSPMPIPTVATPFDFDATQTVPRGPSAGLGEHTKEVLEGLVSAKELAEILTTAAAAKL